SVVFPQVPPVSSPGRLRGYLAYSCGNGQCLGTHSRPRAETGFPHQSRPDRPLPMPYQVAAFYQFAALPDFRELREPLRAICAELELKGSVLLAEEGINGTVAGAAGAIGHFVTQLRGAA